MIAYRVDTKRRDLEQGRMKHIFNKAKEMSDETLKKANETMQSKLNNERRDHSEAVEELRHQIRVLHDLSGNLYNLSTRLAEEQFENGPCEEEARAPPSLEAPLISARSSQAVGSQAVDMRQAVGLHQCGCVVFINVDASSSSMWM